MSDGSSEVTAVDARRVFDDQADRGTPLTTDDVADELGCDRESAQEALTTLRDRGDVARKAVGENCVWWRPDDGGASGGEQQGAAQRETDQSAGGLPEGDRGAEFQALVEAVENYAIFVLDTDGHVQTWNTGAERLKGYSEADIVGEHFSTFYPEDAVESSVPEQNLERARERGSYEEEGWRVRNDGEQFWAHVTITALYEDGDLRGFAKITRDLTDRKQREDRLAALDEMGRLLLGAETTEAVVDAVVEAAEGDLHLPISTVALYDDERATLHAAGQTDRAASLQQSVPLLDPASETAWSAFGDDDPVVVDDPSDEGADHPVTGGVVVPLGRHGVFSSAFTAPGEPSEELRDFVRVVAADLEAALNQTDRERQLRDREAALAERNDSLERLNRINGVIRRIDQALVDATSRADVEQALCNELVTAGPYRFAWVGDYDSTDEVVTPNTWAGVEPDYADSLTLDAQQPGAHPAARAARHREPRAVADVQTDPPFEPWRKEALRRGHRSLVSVPLLYEDSLYGVLTVQADEPGTFEGVERRVVEELAENVAHAINALESKRALVSDDVVELELRVRDRDIPVLALVEAADCAFEFQTVLSREDGSLAVFFETHGASAEDVAAFADDSMALRDLRLVSESDETCRFEATATDQSFVATLLDQGAVAQSITAQDGEGRVVVTLAPGADVREFVEMFQTKYPNSELTARRTRDRRARTPHEFKAVFEQQLTERQREVLQTAYFGGYFESPRQSTGSDIGEVLGVSQPTVNHHLRTAQRVLLGMLYDDESVPALDR